ncbi:MAG: VWA domain-containing protein [Polyangiales bacterium]
MSRLLALVWLLAACTDVGLQDVPAPPAVRDDKVRLEGTLCTGTPGSRVFPLRVLFVVDASESMRVTDAPDPVTGETGRQRAVRQSYETLLDGGPEGIRVGLLRFSAQAASLTPQDRDGDGVPESYFTADPVALDAASALLAETDRTTNYVNALAEALFQLRHRAWRGARVAAAEHIVVFSDGSAGSGQRRRGGLERREHPRRGRSARRADGSLSRSAPSSFTPRFQRRRGPLAGPRGAAPAATHGRASAGGT